MTKNILFCFGLGYVAKELAANLESFEVRGTHTDIKKIGANEYLFDSGNDFSLQALDGVTHIFISIPPTEKGDLVYRRYGEFFKTIKSLKWIGYCSSTSVYGDHQGDLVNETSDAKPVEILGENRLKAEKQWLSTDLPVTILRLSGIYGPGRSLVIDSIETGKAIRIFKAGHYFSRVHVKDIVSIIKAMINEPKSHEIYNIADDYPSAQHEVIEFACNLMGKTLPEMINFEDANLSETMLNYYMSSKRIDNSKVKRDYKLNMEFPSYREGLARLVRDRLC